MLIRNAGVRLLAASVALAMLAGAAAAQGTTFDGALSYGARDEITLDDGTEIDNDIARLTAAIAWSAGDGRMRAALEYGGMNNDDWEGDLSTAYGGELVFARKVGNQRYGIGARMRFAEDLSTATEALYAIEHLGEAFDLRGLIGFHILADADDVPGRGATGAFAQGEATFYATPNWAISVGLLTDDGGSGYGVGTEFRPGGWGGVSLFLDYAEAFDDYRDVASYDAFFGGIRITPGTSSVKAARQSGLARVMHRYFEVQ